MKVSPNFANADNQNLPQKRFHLSIETIRAQSLFEKQQNVS